MKLILFIVVIFISGCGQDTMNINHKETNKHSFQDVWNQVISDKLDILPNNQVSYSKLSKDGRDLIKQDAIRTLESHADILDPFDKLAHPNGICFKGIWTIDQENSYSGYFKKDSKALIIARISTALSGTTNDEKRAFGFAGKLFPTTDINKINNYDTANFFLIDDLGGTNSKYFTDTELTNEPKVSFTYEIFKNLFYALKVASAFGDADKNSHIRQLYEISNLDEKQSNNIRTPKWMKIKSTRIKKIDEKDFRNEIKITDNNMLNFDIFVASKIINNNDTNTKDWEKIGNISLDTSVVSFSCDKRLHFHHPKYRDDLN